MWQQIRKIQSVPSCNRSEKEFVHKLNARLSQRASFLLFVYYIVLYLSAMTWGDVAGSILDMIRLTQKEVVESD